MSIATVLRAIIAINVIGLSAAVAATGSPASPTSQPGNLPGPGTARLTNQIAPTSQPGQPPLVTGKSICLKPAVTDLKIVSSNWPDASSLRQFGLDAIRLENAKTYEQKALAIWRWVRRCTMAAAWPAREPDDKYVSEPWKILNVYGAHHCDGLSRLMASVWMAATGMPAEKLYRSGHTMADCWWPDADGVGRWHLFDVNYGYFLYTRDGTHLACADDIGTDFSLSCLPSKTSVPWIEKQWWMYAAIHCEWDMATGYDGTISLREGEQITRFCQPAMPVSGHDYRPFQGNALRVGPRPDAAAYSADYGTGFSEWRDDFTGDWQSRLAAPAINVRVKGEAAKEVVQADRSKPAELIYRGRFPYVVSDMEIELLSFAVDGVTVDTSVDGGRTWQSAGRPFRNEGDEQDEYKVILSLHQPCYPKGQESTGPMSRQSVIGRYDYLVRLTLNKGASVSKLAFSTILQHNPMVLPNVVPGDNKIIVTGTLAPGKAIEVSYVFKDPDSDSNQYVVRVESLPCAYNIQATGKGWKDVRCVSMTVKAVTADGSGNCIGVSPFGPKIRPPGPIPTLDIRVLNSITPAAYVLQPKAEQDRYKVTTYEQAWAANTGPFEPKLKAVAEYVKDLASADEDTRRFAAAGLTVLRDASAWEPLEKVAMSDASRAKYYAIQALFWTDSKRAWPVMEKVLKRDPAVAFAPDAKGHTEAATHLNVSAMVSALCGKGKIKAAVPLIIDVLVNHSGDWDEPRWAMLRALGRIGDPAAISTLRKFVKGPADPSIVAMEALIALNDREQIPTLVDWLGYKGHSLRPEAGLQGLAAMKADGHAEEIIPLLRDSRPVRHGYAADALAVSGQPAVALPALKAALEKETFEFARQRMEAAIRELEKTVQTPTGK